MINALIDNKRFYYGWIIVTVCFICWLMTDTLGFYTFGLFIGPISEELGWTTFMITLGITIKTASSAVLGPITGFLADKKTGARLVMTFGILAAGASLLLTSNMQSIWHFYLFYGIIGAIGQIGFGGVITHTIIAKWFVRMRGRAMGMATMGVSISGLIFIPFNHYMISNYGWRFTMMIGGLIIWCVALVPTFLFIRRRPEDVGLKPDGDKAEMNVSEKKKSSWAKPSDGEEYSWTLRDALRTRSIWFLLAAFNVTGISLAGVMIHYYAFAESKGISPDTAA